MGKNVKYDFSDLYKNATLLDQDFLRNEFGYSIDTPYDEITYKNYYANICSEIFELNVFAPTSDEIEEFIKTGTLARHPRWKSKIATEQERKYLFLMAQARQLKYDRDNGRAGMIKGENKEYIICEDTKSQLEKIGFVQPVWY